MQSERHFVKFRNTFRFGLFKHPVYPYRLKEDLNKAELNRITLKGYFE